MGVVTFSNKNTVRFVPSKGVPEYEAEIVYVKHALLAFLREDVYDIVLDVGRFVNGNMDPDDVDQVYISETMARLARGLFGARYAAQHFEKMVTNLENYENKPAAALIADAIEKPEKDLLRDSAILLIRTGLRTFIEYKQCKNECSSALDKKHPLKDGCNAEFMQIEQIIREHHPKYREQKTIAKDIVKSNILQGFDQLLRKASHDHCSIVPLKPVATIRIGSKK